MIIVLAVVVWAVLVSSVAGLCAAARAGDGAAGASWLATEGSDLHKIVTPGTGECADLTLSSTDSSPITRAA